METKVVLSWIFRLTAAAILLQTLYFKFTAAPESVYIFTTLGVEPWGRIGAGIAELIVGILLIFPRTAWLGALGGIAVICGALAAHLTRLGIEVQGDGGFLFTMALIALACCVIILFLHRNDAIQFLNTRTSLMIQDRTVPHK